MEYLVFQHSSLGTEHVPEMPGIRVFVPTLKLLYEHKVGLKDYLWKIMTANRYTLFCVYTEDGKCIHRSIRIGRCFKFPFLPKGCYEIGPCHTSEQYRGHGIYPAVLTYIVAQERTTHYMLVRKDNRSSIRGILKAGFVECGYAHKTKFGQWKMGTKNI